MYIHVGDFSLPTQLLSAQKVTLTEEKRDN